MRTVIKKEKKDEKVEIQDCGNDKVYAILYGNEVCKLHEIRENWLFCSFGNSVCGIVGVQNSMKEALERATEGYTVYEFEDQADFLKWLKAL